MAGGVRYSLSAVNSSPSYNKGVFPSSGKCRDIVGNKVLMQETVQVSFGFTGSTSTIKLVGALVHMIHAANRKSSSCMALGRVCVPPCGGTAMSFPTASATFRFGTRQDARCAKRNRKQAFQRKTQIFAWAMTMRRRRLLNTKS
eukprot:6480112-Amphidinium_carterae.1